MPRRVAVRAGQIAYMELVDDIAGRRQYYEELGMPFDDTVELRDEPAMFF